MFMNLRRLHREERGITGLETAIILIAFVVVASVFAYTVLSAGIFSSERSKEAVYSGIEEVRSTLELRGHVTGYKASVSGQEDSLGRLDVILSNSMDGTPINVTAPYTLSGTTISANTSASPLISISYQDKNQYLTTTAWTATFVGKNNSDSLLDANETVVISVWLLDYQAGTYAVASAPFISSNSNLLKKYMDFNVEIRPPVGASIVVSRSTPAKIENVIDLK